MTPPFSTQEAGHLLAGTSFRLYGGPSNLAVALELDFSDRDNLDAATWHGDDSAGRFPHVATVHPHASANDLVIEEVTETAFFGVRPRTGNTQEICAQIEAAREAGIAVLPELSIPAPDVLASTLDASPERFPPLVVAGSAHAELPDDEYGRLRVNQAEAYLNGAPLLRHRKIHPYRTNYLGAGYARQPRTEDLSSHRGCITIAAGTRTRLAVVICADLNDRELRCLLEDAGVNLLLAPALTPLEGAFTGACTQLASGCQALAFIVNGTPTIDPDDPPPTGPFMVMAGAPDPAPRKQVRTYDAPKRRRRAVGIFDTSKTPPAVRWL